MRDPKQDHATMVTRRENMLNAAYRLLTERSITAVTLEEIAKEAGCGKKTLLRYYDSKPGLVIAVATWKWEQFQEENQKRRPNADIAKMTAVEIFEFYLDSFLELYRDHKDLLRFNQFFNVYVQSEHIDAGMLQPYQKMIEELKEQFHEMYLKAMQDETLRVDEGEEKMFSKTLHLMLAAVTRYAVGLVYIPESGFDAEEELETMKEMLLERYRKV